ncbi:hypothetical protein FOXG_21994 [Fusarium oxysporum f. sp. lycopersici 4287]|uniref:Uncharacterized protein n=1 Tax=Fusarium oxysporum f. sp. lycopersici (strain 4287 / CBS 123668 / FGSC 9935 / NRRL 34936) TaxID=426428 RepID=A0A0J9W424_FUSO4|nr:hypothetical protein FOXG_21692 [Fusarium oxysporum f. sp. lycopersici 4287]XP_018255683.1 hypothetical protein FOXG_21994 [Fusarium oxysporum f. sp. lycopersici 4287]KAJ9413274.1 hypothetical protein QL093DRAFT_2570003 [Fusarium oxysporum]KNB16520.1 hypothetical protein FOXG_21692 [Fusarium oxysporum f. sp. lycopersici 4287]KNB17638.1 hypothetical protein FOXG_21994 [Fusarium oxysporum f. sp. lycopersici 4287]
MELVPETAFKPHALNPTLLNNTGGIVTEAPGMPQYGDLITVNSISLGHTVNPALVHATASTGTVTAIPSNDEWRMLMKDCENVPAEVKAKSPGHVINAIGLSRYHWGFLIGPKNEKGAKVSGIRHHVKNHPIRSWIYEEIPLSNVRSTNNLLARIVIAKIEDEGRLVDIIRNTPVAQNDPNWRYRTWVAQALSQIAQDGMATGTAELD